jgi:molecular chaperone DnaK
MDGAEKYIRLLEKSAQENPSPDADAAVATVKSLLTAGVQAIESKNAPKMSEISARLGALTRGR